MTETCAGTIKQKPVWLKTTKEATYTSLAALIQGIEEKPSPQLLWLDGNV